MTATPPPFLPFGPTLGYSVNPIDRLSGRRTDEAYLETLRQAPDAVGLALVGESALLDADGRPFFALAELAALGEAEHHALLGRHEGRAVFATALPEGAVAPGAARTLKDLRALAVEGAMPPAALGALAQAKALFHWHRHHRFCSNCGAATHTDQAGWRRVCPVCETLHFPRTDPSSS